MQSDDYNLGSRNSMSGTEFLPVNHEQLIRSETDDFENGETPQRQETLTDIGTELIEESTTTE